MKRILTLVTALLVITVVAPAQALEVSITEDDPAVCASPVLIGRETP